MGSRTPISKSQDSNLGTSTMLESPTTKRTAMDEPVTLKPFFIMDWLEDLVADQDVHKLASLLKTPNRKLETTNNTNHIINGFNDADEGEMLESQSSFLDNPGTPKSSNRTRKLCHSVPDHHCKDRGRDRGLSRATRPRSTSPLKGRSLFTSRWWDAQSNTETEGVPMPQDEERCQEDEPPSTSASASTQTESLLVPGQNTRSVYQKSLWLANGWNTKGLQKAQQGLWSDALQCWENALEIRLCMLGRNHVDVANTYNNRGIALGKIGDFQGAFEALQLALDIRCVLMEQYKESMGSARGSSTTTWPPNDPTFNEYQSQVVSTLHNIANVHQQTGNLQEALQVFGQARDVLVRAHNCSFLPSATMVGPDGVVDADNVQEGDIAARMQMALICVAMGHVYWQAHQWTDALDAYQDAARLYIEVQQVQQRRGDQPVLASSSEEILTMCQNELKNLHNMMEELEQERYRSEVTTQQRLNFGRRSGATYTAHRSYYE